MEDTTRKWVDEVWDRVHEKMRQVAVRSRYKIPYSTDEQGIHDNRALTEPYWWTNGFWCGLMWLLYIDTGDKVYKDTALEAEHMLDKAFPYYEQLHHDVGFMWHISSGVNFTLHGDRASQLKCFYTADLLAAKFNSKAGFISAWNSKDMQGWTIIDTMMNLNHLYWASRERHAQRYCDAAMTHADMAMRDHVRPDGSVIHIVSHDIHTGEVLGFIDGQGYKADSCWSRGQAWALYGFTLSYIHTGKQAYLDTAKKVAHYFMACCSVDDWRVRVDFRAPKEPALYDSTAAACAACGLIELSKAVPELEKELYLSAALKLLKKLDETCCHYSTQTDYLVGGGTHKYPQDGSMKNVHIPIIYGDYFFVEALYKLRGNGLLFW